MKIRGFVPTVGLLLLAGDAGGDDIVKITLDSTQLCLPGEFAPGKSDFALFLEFNVDGLDSSDGSHILRIPAHIIKARVPEYTERHINRHDVDLEHRISGIAYGASGVGNPNGIAERAWTIMNQEKSPLIEQDESGYFRIYEYGRRTFSWDLVMYPPPEAPTKAVPEGWYVGRCSNTMDICTQHVMYKDIFYQYDIQLLDLPVYREVAVEIHKLFSDWEQACGDET